MQQIIDVCNRGEKKKSGSLRERQKQDIKKNNILERISKEQEKSQQPAGSVEINNLTF